MYNAFAFTLPMSRTLGFNGQLDDAVYVQVLGTRSEVGGDFSTSWVPGYSGRIARVCCTAESHLYVQVLVKNHTAGTTHRKMQLLDRSDSFAAPNPVYAGVIVVDLPFGPTDRVSVGFAQTSSSDPVMLQAQYYTEAA